MTSLNQSLFCQSENLQEAWKTRYNLLVSPAAAVFLSIYERRSVSVRVGLRIRSPEHKNWQLTALTWQSQGHQLALVYETAEH
jgi:hypothetical protein